MHCIGLTQTHMPPEQPQPTPLTAGQFSQFDPHTVEESATQAPAAQWLYPVAQVMPQDVPLQTAVPLGSVGQGLQLAPQLLTLVFDTQLPLQLW